MATPQPVMRQLPLLPLHRPNTSELLSPFEKSYDFYVANYSGGKDSLALILTLLELGVPPERITVAHQAVDGRPHFLGGDAAFRMDWPVTEGYVRATAQALGLTLRWQWREGGFEREMLRDKALSAPVTFQTLAGDFKTVGGDLGKPLTRRRFPQTGSIRNGRWCSPTLKNDPTSVAINNDPAFRGAKICYLTGERREESAVRSEYAEVERHKTSNGRRRVDHYRIVIDRTEAEVWEVIARHRILPHPSTRLGFSRTSCRQCIFHRADEVATLREIDPAGFEQMANYEAEFGVTVSQGTTLRELADRGTSFVRPGDEGLIREAMSFDFDVNRFFLPAGVPWELPRGAFKNGAGPS